jgi:hypothetical protein
MKMSVQMNTENKQIITPNSVVIENIKNNWMVSLNNKTEPRAETKSCPADKGLKSGLLSANEIFLRATELTLKPEINNELTKAKMIAEENYTNSKLKITPNEKKKLDDGLVNIRTSYQKVHLAAKSNNRCAAMTALKNMTEQFNALSYNVYKIGNRLGWKFETTRPNQIPTTLS